MLRRVVVAALLAGALAAWADSIEDKAAPCGACHGEKGLPAEPSIPIIWGQQDGYLYLQLRDFQKGARKDDRMTPIAQTLSKEDALALAQYFSTKSWPNTDAPSASNGRRGLPSASGIWIVPSETVVVGPTGCPVTLGLSWGLSCGSHEHASIAMARNETGISRRLFIRVAGVTATRLHTQRMRGQDIADRAALRRAVRS